MLVTLSMAAVLSVGEPDGQTISATSVECEFLNALLIAEWPSEPPGQNSTFYLDPEGAERPVSTGEAGDQAAGAAEFLAEIFPRLDRPTVLELSGYFGLGPDYHVGCEFSGVRLTPASDSMRDNLLSQEGLQYPRIAVSRPTITADGRFALGGYQWNFVPDYGFADHCLFERIEGEWRIVDCIFHPH
jgi:hypothetical protein